MQDETPASPYFLIAIKGEWIYPKSGIVFCVKKKS